MPKVSVIFISYNQAQFVAKSLVSVLDQPFHDFEVIIADDGSTDGTREIIDEVLANHPRSSLAVRLEKKTNLGVIRNWWRAVDSARGEILVAQAGDDISRANRLHITRRFFATNPGAYGLAMGAQVMDSAGNLLDKTINPAQRFEVSSESLTIVGHDFLKGMHACGASSAFRREVFRAFPMAKHNVYADDRVYAFRAILLGAYVFLPEVGVYWREHAGNLSHNYGRTRGPHLARHYESRVAEFDQHLSDWDLWIGGQAPVGRPCTSIIRDELFHERSRMNLLRFCHQPGLALRDASSALFKCLISRRYRRDTFSFYAKAAAQFLMPYYCQRIIARWLKVNG